MYSFFKKYKWKLKSLLQNERDGVLLGKLLTQNMLKTENVTNLKDTEFKVFSQFGEDGIIQYLISKIDIHNKFFVEFGVENYLESNTRFLLINNNWSGLIIDGDKDNIEYVKNDNIYWKHDLAAIQSFITKENINQLLMDNVKGKDDIGLLSVDIDGNDYWVWESINCISPIIVIAEFNNLFGKERAISIPYNEKFVRTEAHYSNLYFGCSLPALCKLAQEKGYDFIGVNSTCMNAFFIKKEYSKVFYKPTIDEVFINTSIREARDKKGKLTPLKREDSLSLIQDMPVFCLETKQNISLKQALTS